MWTKHKIACKYFYQFENAQWTIDQRQYNQKVLLLTAFYLKAVVLIFNTSLLINVKKVGKILYFNCVHNNNNKI